MTQPEFPNQSAWFGIANSVRQDHQRPMLESEDSRLAKLALTSLQPRLNLMKVLLN